MRHSKIILTISLLTGLAVFFIQCGGNNAWAGKDPRGPQYAGSKVCGSCHQDIANSYAHTHHYQTSAETNASELAKFVTSSNNVFRYNDSSRVTVTAQKSSFIQDHIADGKTLRSAQLDIAIGSAEKAQTYGYWKNDQLFQLPLTYLSGKNSWTNSPGYPTKHPYFDRVIESRCLECHATYVYKTDVASGPLELTEKLDKASLIFGIDCERCHGPAAEHVQFHQENPAAKQAKFITSIKALTRQQQLDLCGVCHSGNDLDVQRTLFAFVPGDTLSNFFFPHFGSGPPNPDVHGKQMQLLQMSKCFQLSKMTCTTCHDTHHEEKNNRELFITKCMSCHQSSQHAISFRTNEKSCVDCHMPLQISKKLNFSDGEEANSIPYMLRTHRIAIYKDEN